jgi:hypothetical protein
MLAFVTPQTPLLPATTYSLSVDSATDTSGGRVVPVKVTFTTAANYFERESTK